MAVSVLSPELRARLTDWCTGAVDASARERRRIGFTAVGDIVTILDRRPPAYPELSTAWSSTPLAQLRHEPDTGRWRLYLPGTGEKCRWEPQEPALDDPLALLTRIESAVRALS